MAEPPQKLIRILLLEDSAIDAELLSGHLAKDKQNFTIERVFSREGFTAALIQGGIDIILSDFSLPDFDGLAALELAKIHAPDLPFIFVSGLMGEEFATSALQRGATDYILKRNLSRVSTSIDRALADVHQRAERRKAEAALRELNATLEQRVAERTRQLQESEARLRTIFETSNQHQGFMTPEGILLDTNALSLEAVGVTLAEVIGKNYWETLWFTSTPGMAEKIRAAVKTAAQGEIFREELQLDLPSGLHWFDLTIRPIYNEFGVIIALIPEAVDFTDRRTVEEALRQSQKMEALGQLTGGIAHDFNNLLTGISGSLELVRRRLAAGRTDGIDRFMDAASTSSQRAAALTHRLLAFARRQSLDTRAEDANALIGSLEDMLSRTLGENTALTIRLTENLWPAMTDANQLENAILNLAINARDAMPEGGRLAIETRNMTINEAITVNGEEMPRGEFVAIAVRDSGMGIEPELLNKVFEPFFTTKPIGQGTGLGLSMIYGFVKQSGGFMKIESQPGEGTCVELFLPKARQTEPELDLGADPQTAIGSGEMVLLVEDDNTLRLLVSEVLTELGYRFIEKSDAQSAIPVLESAQPIDLLITDVGLPVMNGRQLAEIARQHRKDLKILFMTGYAANAAIRSEFLETGMDLITKPFTFDALSKRIRELIEDR